MAEAALAPPRPAGADSVAAQLLDCLAVSGQAEVPFRHWLLHRALPDGICDAIDELPFAPPLIEDTAGRRETNNSTRQFFGRVEQAHYRVCAALAAALQDAAVTRRLQSLCGVDLGGSFLRIEYCMDTDGFWLEPHTDIGAKRFTMLIYLSDTPGCEAWGTDLLDGPDRFVTSVPYRRNDGFIFVPGADTWHGFHRRPIEGVRRSLIVNYVGNEWRARHELAFPDQPVVG